VVGFIVLAVIVSAAGNRPKDTVAPAGPGTAPAGNTCAAFSYPDKQGKDHCAAMGGPVLDFGQTVTAAHLHREPGLFDEQEICADVSYLNRSGGSKSFNQFDWKLQTPSGTVQNFEVTNATLGYGDLIDGGTKSGAVCFKDNGEHGQFVLIWKPIGVRSDRGIWTATL